MVGGRGATGDEGVAIFDDEVPVWTVGRRMERAALVLFVVDGA
jgi:hypothetical protein